MSAEITIEELALQEDGQAQALRRMFVEMYSNFERFTGRHYLRDDAFDKWISNYEKTCGRSRQIFLARMDTDFVGFIEGTLKFSPAYMLGNVLGFVNHIFVDQTARRRNLGADLFEKLQQWFAQRRVEEIQLQIVAGNEPAIMFWRAAGFSDELIQMRIPLVFEGRER